MLRTKNVLDIVIRPDVAGLELDELNGSSSILSFRCVMVEFIYLAIFPGIYYSLGDLDGVR
jgi:hypothetical protein